MLSNCREVNFDLVSPLTKPHENPGHNGVDVVCDGKLASDCSSARPWSLACSSGHALTQTDRGNLVGWAWFCRETDHGPGR